MLPPLDLPTVLLLHKLSFFAAALCFLYVRARSKESVGLGLLAIGFFLVAMASTVVSIGKSVTSFENEISLAGNFVGLLGYSIFWIGMCRISSQFRRRNEWLVLFLPAGVVGVLFFSGLYNETVFRAVGFQTTAMLLLLAAARTVYLDRRLEPLPVRKTLASTIIIAAMLSVVVVVGRISPHSTLVIPRYAFFISIICHFAIAFFVMALVKERAEEHLRRLAEQDVLTGVANRRSFMSHLPQVFCQEDVIVMIDIDRFKQINDSLGHLAGDEILAGVAQKLASQLRPADSFARFGGEEFILYQPGIGREEAVLNAEKALLLVGSTKHMVEDHSVVVTLSMGLAVCEQKSCSTHSLIKKADAALYQSKASGRNRLTVYDDQENEPTSLRI